MITFYQLCKSPYNPFRHKGFKFISWCQKTWFTMNGECPHFAQCTVNLYGVEAHNNNNNNNNVT